MFSLLDLLKESSIVHFYFGLTFFVSGLVINLGQLILFICIKPFSKRLFRKIIYYLNYSLACQIVAIIERWSNVKYKVYITKKDLELTKNEHGFAISNHRYDVDWMSGWLFSDKIGIMGNVKAFVKKHATYVPVFGWLLRFGESVILERSFEKDKENIKRQVNEILDFPDPTWIVIAVEGTRFTETKHQVSVEFAKQRGLPILKHHLTPRTKGFVTCLPILKKKCQAIINFQIAFQKNEKPTIMDFLRGKRFTAHIYIKRIPMSEVPEDEEQAAQWLHNLYVQKDKLQDSFFETGDFFKTSGVEPIEPIEINPRLASLINWVAWMIICFISLMYFTVSMIISGNICYVFIEAALLFSFYILYRYGIRLATVSASSSEYGSKRN